MPPNIPKGILAIIEPLSVTSFVDTAYSRELDRKVGWFISLLTMELLHSDVQSVFLVARSKRSIFSPTGQID